MGNKTYRINPPITLRQLICEDLHYCCMKGFFTFNSATTMIAIRLGVTKRAVCYHKARARDDLYLCENRPNCLCKKMGQPKPAQKPSAEEVR